MDGGDLRLWTAVDRYLTDLLLDPVPAGGEGLPPGGRLVTLEVDPRHAEVARAHLPATVEVIVGPALETLPRLAGPFDLVFIDADKRNNPAYLKWALELSRPGTVIVADNVIRGGSVADPGDADPSVRGVRAFLEALAAEPVILATAIQTVGAKGHDGFALAVVGSGSVRT